jgi:nicotinate-nucleotide pyrophosphorylase (carboxylating)
MLVRRTPAQTTRAGGSRSGRRRPPGRHVELAVGAANRAGWCACEPLVEPPVTAVREAVERALVEDLTPLGDITSALLAPTTAASGLLVARASGVVAGTACVAETCRQVDPALALHWSRHDGDAVEPGTVIGRIDGPLASMLTAERTALNFLGHLSGIATLAARYRSRGRSGTIVWDTRKTTPGLRALEKAAVRAGGCATIGATSPSGSCSRTTTSPAPRSWRPSPGPGRLARPHHPGRVRPDRPGREAVEAGADAVLLDNMSPDEVPVAVEEHAPATPTRCWSRSAGGITLETIGAYAVHGADCISVGALTNSAPVLDIGLDITPEGEGIA